jgi:hypothetical protein
MSKSSNEIKLKIIDEDVFWSFEFVRTVKKILFVVWR